MADAPAAPAAPQTGTTTPTGVQQARAPDGKFQPGKALPIEAQANVGQPKPETEAQKRIRLRLDDKEEEFDETALAGLVKRGKNSAQLMSKAQARFAEAEKRERALAEREARLKSDPFSVLRELGVDPRALSEKEILAAIEEEKERTLPPEERALRQKAREADTLRKQMEEEKASRSKAQEDAETEYHKEQLAGLFTETMERTGLPKSSARKVMHWVAQVYSAAMQAEEAPDADSVAAYVVDNLRAEQGSLVQSMSIPELAAWLGEEKITALRKHDLEQYRARRGAGAAPAPKPVPDAKPSAPNAPMPRKGRWALIEKKYIKG